MDIGKGGKWGLAYELLQVVRAGPTAAAKGVRQARDHRLTLSPAEDLGGQELHLASWLPVGRRGSSYEAEECGLWGMVKGVRFRIPIHCS